MRYLRDVLLLLALLALGAGVVWFQHDRRRDDEQVRAAIDQRGRLDQEIKLRAATKTAELNVRGWPSTISPEWFERSPPVNPLIDADRPWVEVAPPEHAGFEHPPVRMAVDSSLAAFWYNPYNGSLRARVPVMVSDAAATALYNRVNGSVLASIFQRETPTPQLAPAGASDADAHAPLNGARNDGQKRTGSAKNGGDSARIAADRGAD
jgi:hypothetical protein